MWDTVFISRHVTHRKRISTTVAKLRDHHFKFLPLTAHSSLALYTHGVLALPSFLTSTIHAVLAVPCCSCSAIISHWYHPCCSCSAVISHWYHPCCSCSAIISHWYHPCCSCSAIISHWYCSCCSCSATIPHWYYPCCSCSATIPHWYYPCCSCSAHVLLFLLCHHSSVPTKGLIHNGSLHFLAPVSVTRSSSIKFPFSRILSDSQKHSPALCNSKYMKQEGLLAFQNNIQTHKS